MVVAVVVVVAVVAVCKKGRELCRRLGLHAPRTASCRLSVQARMQNESEEAVEYGATRMVLLLAHADGQRELLVLATHSSDRQHVALASHEPRTSKRIHVLRSVCAFASL